MSIATVRSAMATALRTIDGLRASEYITEQVSTPQAMFDYEVEPDLTFARGGDVYRFTVLVACERSPERASQVYLDLLRDPSSSTAVKYVLENNATLAAQVDYARVTRIGRVDPRVIGATEYLCCDFDVEVVL